MTGVRRLALILFLLGCRSALPAPDVRDAGPDGPGSAPLPPTIGPMTLPDARDGSRLKARRWIPDDGAEVPGNAILDTLLDANCSWELYEGGTYRCLPAHPDTVYYADSQCTQPLLLVRTPNPCSPPPSYVNAVPTQRTCPASTVVRRRGARVQPSDVFWSVRGCVRQAVPAGAEVYEVGETVPASTFVGATRQMEPLAEGWSRVYLEGEDGSRWVSGLRRGDVDCQIAVASDRVLRCVPVADWSIPFGWEGPDRHARLFLTEPDCTSPAASGSPSSCAAESVLVSDRRSSYCTGQTAVRRATRRLEVAYDGVSCQPVTDTSSEAFGVGEELPPGGFPEATRGLLDGPGRLKRYATQTPAGVHGISSLWDSQLGGACSLVPDGDGSYRCVPHVTFGSAMYFSDASCRHRIVEDDQCSFVRFFAERQPGQCSSEYRVFRLGAVTPVAAPYRMVGDQCTSTSAANGTIFREIGQEVSLGDFVRIEVSP